MNKDILIKEEPSYPISFECKTCGIEFNHQSTCNAHRQHYCIKHETRKSHSTDSTQMKSMKRKSSDIIDSSSSSKKRLSLLTNDKFSSPFDHPIHIGPFLYIPIPILPPRIDHDNKPLDLTKPKIIHRQFERSNAPLNISVEKEKEQKFYQCEYCSIYFHSLKTLHAHQEIYCMEYRKQYKAIDQKASASRVLSKSNSSLFLCRLCNYHGNSIRGMRMHLKFHLLNNQSCSDDDIIVNSSMKTSFTISANEFLLKCTICSAMFDYEQTLFNHIQAVHIDEDLLECFDCQSRFSSKWNLIRHMKLTHTNIKYEEEEEEEKKSSDSPNLIRTVMIPNLNKIYSCRYCHIKFANIDTLKEHMTNYCLSRPRKTPTDCYCSSCQISFQHKTSYKAHKMFYCRGDTQSSV